MILRAYFKLRLSSTSFPDFFSILFPTWLIWRRFPLELRDQRAVQTAGGRCWEIRAGKGWRENGEKLDNNIKLRKCCESGRGAESRSQEQGKRDPTTRRHSPFWNGKQKTKTKWKNTKYNKQQRENGRKMVDSHRCCVVCVIDNKD